ncbi:hypothetical protein AB5I41_16505 [Sphingomonas sp. MMS24-JH45]
MTRSSGAAKAGGLAANHAAYVERIDAVEIGLALDHAGYVERGEAVEVTDSTAVQQHRSANPHRLRSLWEAVDSFERQGHAGLTIKAGGVGDWLEAVASELPPVFVAHCRGKRKRWATSRTRGKSFKAKRYHAEQGACDAILSVLLADARLAGEGLPPSSSPPVPPARSIATSRNCPDELGPSDRAAIVRNFRHHLGSFARDAEGRATGMTYNGVIHAGAGQRQAQLSPPRDRA